MNNMTKAKSKSKKTITASQYDALIIYQKVINMHQDIIDQLYDKVQEIVPEESLGGGLWDTMRNDFDTLDEGLERLGYKVKAK